ncbi:uncharacterized protein LOC132557313 [Ylistrum balloti]|uniref:uncharacterized protein LOC132557313 n=1 Tax=Ylistrum balloti TaxID=509963 RepID=UPI002905851D|nr:uncharacterized protein LOC132557313 [Ylistrum balloti]
MKIKQVFENNRQWLNKKLELDSNYFKKLSQGQSPKLLYIGCADSRVSCEEIMGLSPGEVFVHRNIANLVPSNDLSSMSVIQYAVEHLKVKHLIVCGHYECGGVKAALEPQHFGLLNPWLRNIRDVYRTHQEELDLIQNQNERHCRLVELNVREQCINVLKETVVQEAIRQRTLNIHGWVFDVHTGKLIDLKIDFKALLKNITNIYRLDG